MLSPVFAAAAAEGGKAKQVPGAVDPLLPLLPELKQWVVYGFLLCPEELATPGAPELLLTVLSTMYVLPVFTHPLCLHCGVVTTCHLYLLITTSPLATGTCCPCWVMTGCGHTLSSTPSRRS